MDNIKIHLRDQKRDVGAANQKCAENNEDFAWESQAGHAFDGSRFNEWVIDKKHQNLESWAWSGKPTATPLERPTALAPAQPALEKLIDTKSSLNIAQHYGDNNTFLTGRSCPGSTQGKQ